MNQRINSLEYIRGIAMMGVVGIHTGAWMLSYSDANMHLFAFMEIISRFSVPIFFFVSAFSLFRQYPVDMPFDVGRFYKRRFSRVLFPYVIGSILYMLHYSYQTADWSIWFPILIYEFFLFGKASYQLYFLVVLLWFYLLMPLWRIWVCQIIRRPGLWLGILFLAQIGFNYYSCYKMRPTFASFYLNLFLEYRMSWLLLHYLFIFLLGGFFASRYDETMAWLRQRRSQVQAFLVLSIVAMLAHYYFLIISYHYSLEAAVNTVQQLSPAGVVYSLAASLYLMLRFEEPLQPMIQNTLKLTGRYSYGIFWIHTLIMDYFFKGLSSIGWSMNVPVTLLFYAATLVSSLGLAMGATALMKKLQSK